MLRLQLVGCWFHGGNDGRLHESEEQKVVNAVAVRLATARPSKRTGKEADALSVSDGGFYVRVRHGKPAADRFLLYQPLVDQGQQNLLPCHVEVTIW